MPDVRTCFFRMSSIGKGILLFLPALVGCLVGFWRITGRGLYYHDEAAFLSSGRFYGGLLRFVVLGLWTGNLSVAALAEQARLLWRMGGTPWQSAKPAYASILIFLSAVFGSSELVGLLVSAVAGTATIVMLIRMAGQGQNRLAGSIAAMLLSVSVWHAHYSRSGLSQALSLLMVCVVMDAMLRYERNDQKPIGGLCVIGCLTGMAFTTHYNLFWLPFLVTGWLGWSEWYGLTGFRRWLRRMSALAGMMCAPLVAFEIPYRIIMPLARSRVSQSEFGDKAWVFRTYFEQLRFQLGFNLQIMDVGANPASILQILTRLESVPFLLLLLAGAIYLAWRAWQGDRPALLLLLWALIPYSIWSLFGVLAPRSFLPVLPPLVLGAGLLIERLWLGFPRRPKLSWPMAVTVGLFLGFTAIGQISRLVPLVESRSAWRSVANEIILYQDRNGESVIAYAELSSYAQPIYRYYLQQTVKRDLSEGDLFLVDVTARLQPALRSKIINAESQCKPAISIFDDLDVGMIMEDAFEPLMIARYRSGQLPHRIDVYELRHCG